MFGTKWIIFWVVWPIFLERQFFPRKGRVEDVFVVFHLHSIPKFKTFITFIQTLSDYVRLDDPLWVLKGPDWYGSMRSMPHCQAARRTNPAAQRAFKERLGLQADNLGKGLGTWTLVSCSIPVIHPSNHFKPPNAFPLHILDISW